MHFRALLVLFAVPWSAAAQPALNRQFQKDVRPFVTRYCAGCHSGQSPAGQFDLKSYTTLDQVTHDYNRWALVADKLTAKQMPPSPVPPPPETATRPVIAFVEALRAAEIKKSAGDPGPVLPRRLSNAEYGYTIRDLTGQDLRPTRQFPLDPSNTAGFDNSGESLTTSAALLSRYLQAARDIADHAVLQPDGIDFAAYPMLVETDREKYAVQRIVDFYLRQPTDFADYFQAAWRYQHRAELGTPSATLASIAADSKVSPKYLPAVWAILHDSDAAGPVATLETMFRDLPAPGAPPNELRAKCVAMRDFVVRIRRHTAMQFAAPAVRGLPQGSEPLLNWKNLQFAAHRRESDPQDLRNDSDPPPVVPTIPKRPDLHRETAPYWAAVSSKERATDADLVVPAAERKRYEAAFSRFASVFPDAFFISERGRYFPENIQDRGRLLSAGYHNSMGYFRDDTPLIELILDDQGRRELDRLWNEFDFIAAYTAHTWEQFFLNNSGEVQHGDAEAGTPRPVNHEITETSVIESVRDQYLAKAAANPANDPVAPRAIHEFFDGVNTTLRALEKQQLESEPKHLAAILDFAARAYRRPLTAADRDDITGYYRDLRDKNHVSHEDAIRASIAAILVSPDFLYRIDLIDPAIGTPVTSKARAPEAARPLSPYALASRLSYFLWSSTPDAELLRHAASSDLAQPDVLLAQTRRMLNDAKIRGLVTEFAGNWLDFRHFETLNTVDRDRFPEFDNELREAMYQEPIRFIENLIHSDGSVLDLVYGRHTFVNSILAWHYDMPHVEGSTDKWVRIDNADQYGRGGLLPMAVFLTQSSPGLRTSAVKRGYWVVHRVLGEVIPPPPPVVPELPADETHSDLPLRDMLARHRSVAMCASCHARFDSFGLAFEGYGPVGEKRTQDLAGRAVDASAQFPGGVEGSGLAGVQAYIRDHRQADFIANISRKLIAYALNRSLQLSDEQLVDRAESALRAKEYRFSTLVETIVTSPQFRTARGQPPPRTSSVESKR
jgi:hypothetical protein